MLLALTLILVTPILQAQEPDGSRPASPKPFQQTQPAPPDWLRATSHALACVDTQHYLYEVYRGPDDTWIVRYVMLPEGNEAYRELEQVFLFNAKAPRKTPKEIKPQEVRFDPELAVYAGKNYPLADRRDLMKP